MNVLVRPPPREQQSYSPLNFNHNLYKCYTPMGLNPETLTATK